jgi:MHS family proline/betaine transporter-like MFS transporter
VFFLRKTHKASIGLSLVGVIIEYFDYALYGFLATEITAHFFPHHSIKNGLLNTFAIFAMGSVAKPFGNIVFARIGDHKGRAQVIRIGLWGLLISTLGLGLIPSYDTWGIWSLIGLIICRFIQGAVIGGQTDGIRLLITEHIGPRLKHFSHGIMGASSSIGIFMAAYAAGRMHHFPHLHWQDLYLMGASLCFVLVILRHWIVDSSIFVNAKKKMKTPISTRDLFWKNKALFLIVVFVMGTNGGIYHFFAIFLNSYTTDLMQIFTQEEGAQISTLVSMGYAIGGLLLGGIIDVFNRDRICWIIFIGLILCCLSLCYVLVTHTFSSLLFFGLGFFLSGSSMPILVTVISHLPVRNRYRFLGFSHVMGSLIFSGTTPLISTRLFHLNWYLPIVWLYVLLFLYMGSTYALFKQKKRMD